MSERVLRRPPAVNGGVVGLGAVAIVRLVASQTVAAGDIIVRGGNIAIRGISSPGTWRAALAE
jgi:hypothetical protein